jgi:hypothetical protein
VKIPVREFSPVCMFKSPLGHRVFPGQSPKSKII